MVIYIALTYFRGVIGLFDGTLNALLGNAVLSVFVGVFLVLVAVGVFITIYRGVKR